MFYKVCSAVFIFSVFTFALLGSELEPHCRALESREAKTDSWKDDEDYYDWNSKAGYNSPYRRLTLRCRDLGCLISPRAVHEASFRCRVPKRSACEKKWQDPIDYNTDTFFGATKYLFQGGAKEQAYYQKMRSKCLAQAALDCNHKISDHLDKCQMLKQAILLDALPKVDADSSAEPIKFANQVEEKARALSDAQLRVAASDALRNFYRYDKIEQAEHMMNEAEEAYNRLTQSVDESIDEIRSAVGLGCDQGGLDERLLAVARTALIGGGMLCGKALKSVKFKDGSLHDKAKEITDKLEQVYRKGMNDMGINRSYDGENGEQYGSTSLATLLSLQGKTLNIGARAKLGPVHGNLALSGIVHGKGNPDSDKDKRCLGVFCSVGPGVSLGTETVKGFETHAETVANLGQSLNCADNLAYTGASAAIEFEVEVGGNYLGLEGETSLGASYAFGVDIQTFYNQKKEIEKTDPKWADRLKERLVELAKRTGEEISTAVGAAGIILLEKLSPGLVDDKTLKIAKDGLKKNKLLKVIHEGVNNIKGNSRQSIDKEGVSEKVFNKIAEIESIKLPGCLIPGTVPSLSCFIKDFMKNSQTLSEKDKALFSPFEKVLGGCDSVSFEAEASFGADVGAIPVQVDANVELDYSHTKLAGEIPLRDIKKILTPSNFINHFCNDEGSFEEKEEYANSLLRSLDNVLKIVSNVPLACASAGVDLGAVANSITKQTEDVGATYRDINEVGYFFGIEDFGSGIQNYNNINPDCH